MTILPAKRSFYATTQPESVPPSAGFAWHASQRSGNFRHSKIQRSAPPPRRLCLHAQAAASSERSLKFTQIGWGGGATDSSLLHRQSQALTLSVCSCAGPLDCREEPLWAYLEAASWERCWQLRRCVLRAPLESRVPQAETWIDFVCFCCSKWGIQPHASRHRSLLVKIGGTMDQALPLAA